MVLKFVLKVLIWQKPSRFFFHRGPSGFFSRNSLLCKPSSDSPVCFLCTRGSDFNPAGRWTDRKNGGQSGKTKNTFRHKGEDLWDDALQRRRVTKSVFAAGTAKRTAEMLRRKSPLEDQVDQDRPRKTGPVQPPDRPLSVIEWRKLKESLGNSQRFETQMMCAMFTSGTQLDIAKSLLTFVATDAGTLSYELLLRYLTLCVSGGHDAEASEVYDIMRGSFPSLDTGASSLFIKSFSRTEKWREALIVLDQLNKVLTASARNYGDAIAGAAEHSDAATAWALYEELLEKGLCPHEETWDVLFKSGTLARPDGQETLARPDGQETLAQPETLARPDGQEKLARPDGQEKLARPDGQETLARPDGQEKLLRVLLYMRDNQIYPGYGLASTIKAWFESLPGQPWTGSWTRATPKGVCGCCQSELESIQLTAAEYQQLRDRVMADVIQGRDVFTKTTPEELERFEAFVRRKPAFDVVVDGLNVANISKDKSRQSETLLAVVSELERQGLTVLVLGRRHMLRPSRSWGRQDMSLVQQKAHCFFTENISEDDPFLLYAALHSGNHCRFVSRDLMRDHKARLADGATRRLFFKWQRGHQMVVDGSVSAARRVRFLSVPSYDTIVQRSEDSWHVPYDDTQDRSTYEVPQRWLCLTRGREKDAHS